MQEISIKGLQSNLKSKVKIQMLKKDIGIEALDKIYNQKYKQYIYILSLGFQVCSPKFST